VQDIAHGKPWILTLEMRKKPTYMASPTMEVYMSKVRMNIEVSPDVAALIEELAQNEGATKTEIVRRALSVMKAYRQQKERGRSHIGFVEDPTKLDAELLGILN